MKKDILYMDKIQSLPHPLTAILYDKSGYWIESLCVQTGCMRLDVCGQSQLSHFDEVMIIKDIDGNLHAPDVFWIE